MVFLGLIHTSFWSIIGFKSSFFSKSDLFEDWRGRNGRGGLDVTTRCTFCLIKFSVFDLTLADCGLLRAVSNLRSEGLFPLLLGLFAYWDYTFDVISDLNSFSNGLSNLLNTFWYIVLVS